MENKIVINGKEIKDECSRCGEILQCELTRDGHALGRERNNITEMIKCQMEHKRLRLIAEGEKNENG